jgi:hypothetical protein
MKKIIPKDVVKERFIEQKESCQPQHQPFFMKGAPIYTPLKKNYKKKK